MSNIIEGITKDLKAIPKNLKTKVGDMDTKKLVLLNLPYIFGGYFCDKVAWLWRVSEGTNASDKMMAVMNDMLPDDENSKSSVCVEKAFKIWEDTADKRSAQLIFCDLSTPKGDGTFNVYEDIRDKLIAKGVPPEEIAFIHDANTETRKAELFAKVRSRQVRFLLGSTQKMGAGTNVQDRLIALHHLDVPWRPSDIEQQEGRILRQGNTNPKVKIFRYVTEGTFDAYSWVRREVA